MYAQPTTKSITQIGISQVHCKEFYKGAAERVSRYFLCIMLPAMAMRQAYFLMQRKGKENKTLYCIDNQGRSIIGWLDVLDYIKGTKQYSHDHERFTKIRLDSNGKPYVYTCYANDRGVIWMGESGRVYTQVNNRRPKEFHECSDVPVDARQLGGISLFNRLGFVDLSPSVDGSNG